MFKIGDVNLKNKVVLAPMAGVSNPAYMKICEEMGVGYAVTELISAEAIVRENKKTLDMLNGYDNLNIPVAIQLFGSNPDVMAKASQIVSRAHHFRLIDINMGCPVPKVALRSEAGSALLKKPEKAFEIVKRVCESVDIPVTVKIRSGWDSNSINAVEIAKLCEKAGAKAITVHGRTRSQGYSGKADWNIIKAVKANVDIPVIGNGDIKTAQDAKRMIDETSCDAVMIGRGALGNPWLIENTVSYLEAGELFETVTYEEKINMIKKHLKYLMEIKKEGIAVKEMRTHTAYYLKGLPHTAEVKKEVFKVVKASDFIKILDDYLESLS